MVALNAGDARAAPEEAGGATSTSSSPPSPRSLLLLVATTAFLLSGFCAASWLSFSLAKHVAWQVGGKPAIATGLGLTWGAPLGATLLAAARVAESWKRRGRRRGKDGAAAAGKKKGE